MIDPGTEVSLVVGGREIRGWTSYTITPSSLIEPVGSFELSLPGDREAWDLVRREVLVRVMVGGVPVITGYAEEPEYTDDDTITVRGRCKLGRLAQESAPSLRWEGLTLAQLATKLAAPWFGRVTLSNERNRRLARGRGRKAVAAAEPLRVDPRPGGVIAEPGQTRLAILEDLLRQAGAMIMSSGDGEELVICRPNHDQAAQWRLFRPASRSRRTAEATVLSMAVRASTADRYSRVIVTGSGRGTDTSYGPAVASRYGEALDGPGPEGTGGDFIAPKRLVLHEPVRSVAEARELAQRELARRSAQGLVVRCKAAGHGQVLSAGAPPTLFAADTIASVEHEPTGTAGAFLVVGVTFASSRAEGETTELQLYRRGVELAP